MRPTATCRDLVCDLPCPLRMYPLPLSCEAQLTLTKSLKWTDLPSVQFCQQWNRCKTSKTKQTPFPLFGGMILQGCVISINPKDYVSSLCRHRTPPCFPEILGLFSLPITRERTWKEGRGGLKGFPEVEVELAWGEARGPVHGAEDLAFSCSLESLPLHWPLFIQQALTACFLHTRTCVGCKKSTCQQSVRARRRYLEDESGCVCKSVASVKEEVIQQLEWVAQSSRNWKGNFKRFCRGI